MRNLVVLLSRLCLQTRSIWDSNSPATKSIEKIQPTWQNDIVLSLYTALTLIFAQLLKMQINHSFQFIKATASIVAFSRLSCTTQMFGRPLAERRFTGHVLHIHSKQGSMYHTFKKVVTEMVFSSNQLHLVQLTMKQWKNAQEMQQHKTKCCKLTRVHKQYQSSASMHAHWGKTGTW